MEASPPFFIQEEKNLLLPNGKHKGDEITSGVGVSNYHLTAKIWKKEL